ncbi:MAG: hypothetical protein FJZ11_05800 [Candidatus Omnitrophica bacterium]|nr:hypothetical protein [Candidatus Omnitrophota bacterium]
MTEIGNFTNPPIMELISPVEQVRLLDFVGYQAIGMVGMVDGAEFKSHKKPRTKRRGSKYKRPLPVPRRK